MEEQALLGLLNMAEQVKNATFKGMHTKESEYDQSVPDGSLQNCLNFNADKVGALTVRRGFAQELADVPANVKAKQFYEYQSTLLTHSSDGLIRKNVANSWTDLGNGTSFAAPDPTLSRLKSNQASKSIYFGDAAAVRKLDSITGSIYNAGLPQVPSGLVVGGSLIVNSTPYNLKWAVRFVFTYTDANGIKYRGAPSGRYVFAGIGTTGCPVVWFPLPSTITVNHTIETYCTLADIFTGSDTSDGEPSEEYKLVFTTSISATDISNGYVMVILADYRHFIDVDVATNNLVGETLYSSPSQEGVNEINRIPPVCKDMTNYKDYSLFANTKGKYVASSDISQIVSAPVINGKTYSGTGASWYSEFISTSGWTQGAGWTITTTGGGYATAAGAISTLLYYTSSVFVPNIPIFQVAIDITTRSAGSLIVRMADGEGHYISGTTYYNGYTNGYTSTDTIGGTAVNNYVGWLADLSLLVSPTTITAMTAATPGTITPASTVTNRVLYTASGSAIGGLTNHTEYWTTAVGDGTYYLSTTQANKDAGTYITLTGALPVGTHTLSPKQILTPGQKLVFQVKPTGFTGVVDKVSYQMMSVPENIFPQPASGALFWGQYTLNAGEALEYYTQTLAGVCSLSYLFKQAVGYIANTVTDLTPGVGQPWTNPSYASALDASYATATSPQNVSTNALYFLDYGFNIPATATITGARISLAAFVGATATSTETSVKLVYNGSVLGDTFALAYPMLTWTTPAVFLGYPFLTNTSMFANTTSALNPSVVNDSSFGFRISIMNKDVTTRVFSVDYARIVIYYTDNTDMLNTYHETNGNSSTIYHERPNVADAVFTANYGFQNNIIGTLTATQDVYPNALWWSKLQQPDSTTLLNYTLVGDKTKNILRILPLRESVIILKEDGVWRLTGADPSSFSIDMLNRTVNCLAADSAVMMDNKVYCFTNNGFVEINDVGVNVVSRQIEDQLLTLIDPAQYQTYVTQYGFAMAYETDRMYIYFTPVSAATSSAYAFAYNFFTQQWTKWYNICGDSMLSGYIRPSTNTMYLEPATTTAPYNYIMKERKSGSRTTCDLSLSYTVSTVTANADGTYAIVVTTTPNTNLVYGCLSTTAACTSYAYITNVNATSKTITILGNPESIASGTVYGFMPILATLQTNYDRLDGITSLKRVKEIVVAHKDWGNYYNTFTFSTDVMLDTSTSSSQTNTVQLWNENSFLIAPATYPRLGQILHKRQILPSDSRLCGSIYFNLNMYAIAEPLTLLGYNWLYEAISNRLMVNG